jgi:nicotinate dehydrogenase subunit B
VILHVIASPVSRDLGYLPPFRDRMTAGQITELMSYLRQQFTPDKQPWTDVAAAVDRAILANVH